MKETNESAADTIRARIIELAQQYEAWCSGDGRHDDGVLILRELCKGVRALLEETEEEASL